MDQGVGKRSFYAEGMQQGAPMSRTPSLRPEDAGKQGYPSISPTGQVPYQQQIALVEGQGVHRPSLTRIQHTQPTWNSDNSMSSNPHSPHSAMGMMRSNSSSASQIRHRPAPLNLQTGSHILKSSESNEHLKVEGSPFDPNFRSASAMSLSPYGQAYQQHQVHRLNSAPSMSGPSSQTTQSGFYSATHYSYQEAQQLQQPQQHQIQQNQSHQQQMQQQQHQQPPLSSHQHAPQLASGVSYAFSTQLPSLQHYVHPYNARPVTAGPHPYGMQHSSHVQPGQPPQMPPLTHMAHSAPSAIPQQSSSTTAAYHEHHQQRPNLLHTFSSMPSGGSSSDRPEYTGFSSYPIQRGQDRPHKCDQSEYTPPSGANRKNAAAIPRHYQNLSKKALQAKQERQQLQQDQGIGSHQTGGSRDSDSGSDRSKSESDKEDEPMEVKMQPGQPGGPYTNLPSLPALSPPTPQMATTPQYPNQGGQSMVRSASHNLILVTPDESSIHIPPPKLAQKSNSSPFLTNHSQSVYSHLIPEKSIHPNGQYINHDVNSQSRPIVPQYSIPPDAVDSGRVSIPSSGANPDQFVWQQRPGISAPNSIVPSIPVATADRPTGLVQHANSAESMKSAESVVSLTNPYVKVSAASPAVLSTLAKPTRNSQDYFDGIAISDKSAQPSMEVDPTASSGNIAFAPAFSAQNQDAVQRPVFTMPFGNSKPDQPMPENASTETSQMTGQWQRWHRPSFPFPAGGQMQQRSDTAHSDNNGFAQQSTLHPGMQQPQNYARSSLRLSHSPINIITTQQPPTEFPLQPPPTNAA
ncbi:hypothetical protein QFC21_006496 [Naganishia friedmannii]|uniref:Uncharacterized protein n=1 Tax=Naganishia friedmannii TaxID=89922 RepID=A0ACC2V2D3_9TREE|nr:hypothetical protein QFC21_006496 [Naganishia friedmannii]